jgi:formate dehydrogenase alpha subunit
VEEERSKALLAACVTPIRPGMVINTRSPRVIERRKIIIQLMLASHPDSCLVCDKGNRCQLRKLAAEMGLGLSVFQRIPQASIIEDINPFIERDLSKCILCAKCLRADQELVVEGALDYIGRGFTAKPATLDNRPLERSECTFCGTCVALCPTGALMEKEKSYHGTATTTVATICPFCACGCGISLEVKDNQLIRARPSADSPVNHGTLCVRGCYGYDFIHSADRLTSPLIKADSKFATVSWEQALDKVATELERVKAQHGPDSLAILGSAKCTNEENYLLQRWARSVLGTNNIDNGSRLYGLAIGFRGTTSSLDNLEKSDVIVVIGCDPTVSAPVVGYAIKRAVRYKGAKLLLIDPRRTRLAPFAQLWLRPRIGTDVALVNGLARVLIEERLFNEVSVTSRTENFTELKASLKTYTPKKVEETAGIPRQDVELAARLLAHSERPSIVYGNGITQHVTGTDTVVSLTNLAMLIGAIGRQGGGIFALHRENNALGACDMGSLPDFLPGYRAMEDGEARRDLEERWKVRLPVKAGLTALEMIEQIEKGNIKGMLIMGENPVPSFPSSSRVREALASLEFLVVLDLFLTETAKLAHVVLPAASFAEKEGTFTNFEGRVQPVRKAIEPVGNSLPDWQIIQQLASRMGHPMPYASLQQVMDEIEELIPGYRLPETNPEKEGLERGRFRSVQYTAPTNALGDEYQLTLLSGSVLPHFGSGTRSSRASRLKKFSSHAWVEISQSDAQSIGLSEGDRVKITSAAGELTTKVRITDTLLPGTLFMPMSFPESSSHELFGITLDPQSKTPSLKACAVRLERIKQDD